LPWLGKPPLNPVLNLLSNRLILWPIYFPLKVMFSRAMAQAVSRRPLTAEARVRAEVSPGAGETGTGTGFFPSTSVFPCRNHPPWLYVLAPSGGWPIGPLMAAIQRHSHPIAMIRKKMHFIVSYPPSALNFPNSLFRIQNKISCGRPFHSLHDTYPAAFTSIWSL
jgi:hypothetical protein